MFGIGDIMVERKLDEIEMRLRVVEQAVVEISLMGKYFKVIVTVIALSFGMDLSGAI